MQEVRRTFEEGNFREGSGNYRIMDTYEEMYVQSIVDTVGRLPRTSGSLDCGNAVPAPSGQSSGEAGVDVPLHCDWDNSFPNHPPDPTRQENMEDLGRAVLEHGAEFV